MWVIELEKGVWLDRSWTLDEYPGETTTHDRDEARRFLTERGARRTLKIARQHESFSNAVVRLAEEKRWCKIWHHEWEIFERFYGPFLDRNYIRYRCKKCEKIKTRPARRFLIW